MLKGAIRDDIARLDRKYRHRIFPAPSPYPKKRDYFNSLLDGKIQFRLETMMAGNDYVGPKAARDDLWIDRVYTGLLTNFERGVKGYVDVF